MVHYNVYFTLKDNVEEERGLKVVQAFLAEVCASGEAAAFRIDKVVGADAAFLAVIEFVDDGALGRAMKSQHARGVREGAHGKVVEVVKDFRVKVVEVPATEPMLYACEI
jgi:hypothetical protein